MNNVLRSTTNFVCSTLDGLAESTTNLLLGFNGVTLAARYEGESFARVTQKTCATKELRLDYENEVELAAIKQMMSDNPLPSAPLKKPTKVKKAGTG